MAENTVTKRDMAIVLAEKYGFTQLEATDIIQTFLDEIVKELANANRLEFRKFGVFEPKIRKGRQARNPRTNEELFAEAKATVAFKVGKEMKEKVQDAMPKLQENAE